MNDHGASGQNPVPGYYYAAGDPPGTVRQWDGTQWLGDPMPAPPEANSAVDDNSKFATVGVRIGAALIDGLLSIIVFFIVIALLGDTDTSDGGFEITGGGVETVIAIMLILAVYTTMIATKGATPGKLMLGLRITMEDGVTTPPGGSKAIIRNIPGLIGIIPLIGQLVSLGFVIMSLIWVSGDSERRSAYDRIAGTRVVYANKL
jgi:uncharacterized RDD family membrane protein YckC